MDAGTLEIGRRDDGWWDAGTLEPGTRCRDADEMGTVDAWRSRRDAGCCWTPGVARVEGKMEIGRHKPRQPT
jgi:hypothetical protein